MKYRINAKEDVLRDEHQTARATLEEMAEENKYISFDDDNPYVEEENFYDSLTRTGFEQRMLSDIPVYVREGEDITDIFADCPLDGSRMSRGYNLYQLLAEQDVQEWYDLIPEQIEKNDKTIDNLNNRFPLITIPVGLGIGSLVGVSMVFAGIAIGMTALYVFGSFKVFDYYGKRTPLHKELKATGSKALKHIAKTTFEEAEEFKRKPVRIYDDEFSGDELKEHIMNYHPGVGHELAREDVELEAENEQEALAEEEELEIKIK